MAGSASEHDMAVLDRGLGDRNHADHLAPAKLVGRDVRRRRQILSLAGRHRPFAEQAKLRA
jgi:hypothetical protein